MNLLALLSLVPLLVSAAPVSTFPSSSSSSPSACPHAPPHPGSASTTSYYDFPTLAEMTRGNEAWASRMELEHPGVLGNLSGQAQHPKAYVLMCPDSRIPIEVVTNQSGGTYFVDRNTFDLLAAFDFIANQYSSSFEDIGTESAVAYAVEHLLVKHLIVLGHYGCGGIAAAIATPRIEDMNNLGSQKIADWVRPIRKLFLSSERTEIVAYRELTKGSIVEAPVYALVEENVKAQAKLLAQDDVINHMWKEEESQIFIHSWVYDLDSGYLSDLNFTVGPDTLPELYMPLDH